MSRQTSWMLPLVIALLLPGTIRAQQGAQPGAQTMTLTVLMIGLDGDPYRIRHDGFYADTYRKTPQGWRFASRIHHVAMTPPGGITPAPTR